MRKNYYSIIHCELLELDVPKFSDIVVRLTCTSSKYFQECRIQRGNNSLVDVMLRDFSGSRFRLQVSTSRKSIKLISPDLSWMADTDTNNLLRIVIAEVFSMLRTKRSTRKLIFYRQDSQLAHSENI